MNRHFGYRNIKNLLFRLLVIVLTFITITPLIAILVYIIRQGISVINWHFLTSLPKPVGETGGGVFNALIGSLLLILVATLVAAPIGVTTGMYFSENSDSRIYKIAHLGVDVLQGIPSIVIGIIIYLWLVKPFGKFSAFSGSIALAFMMLPSIIKSTEETLKLVPSH